MREQVLFTRRLSVYLSAGVPILEALALLAEDAGSKSTSHVFSTLTRAIAEGRPLSSGLQEFPSQVGAFTVSMIEVGERSGTLKESLTYLATALRKQQALQRKLVGALVYPAIIVLTTIAISTFLILYAFPKIVPLFRGFDSTLPFATRALIFVSDTLSRYGIAILLFLGASITLFWLLLHKPTIRRSFDAFLLHIPIFGSLLRAYCLASVSRTLATLLKSGVDIVSALELASATTKNQAYAVRILSARDHVLEGRHLSGALLENELCFPRMYTQMVGTGERTGSLPETCRVLAEHYEEEFDAASESVSSLIEPVLMVVMGLLVGFIALAIIMPVYQITQDMHA